MGWQHILEIKQNLEIHPVPSGMNATPVAAMSSCAPRHCTWRMWHQRSRIPAIVSRVVEPVALGIMY